MASLWSKAARVSLVSMDFVLQVTVEELVLNTLDIGRMLSFELSRGTKMSRLPPKLVSTTRSEWRQTMQLHLTLFLDRRSGRFQDKEYKLRLVQQHKGNGTILLPALATFTLDASLYAHLGAGPSVEQQVDLYAPKLNGLGGFATVSLRVRCCDRAGDISSGRPISTSDVSKSSVASTQGRPSNVSLKETATERPNSSRPQLPTLQSGMLVGSSFGFSLSGSESRHSAASPESSGMSTPRAKPRRSGRPWSVDTETSAGALARSKLSSKSFNDLDDVDNSLPLDERPLRKGTSVGGSMSLHESIGSNGDSAGGQSPRASGGEPSRLATGVLTSESTSCSGSSAATDVGSKVGVSPAGMLYDRTTTAGYNRLLARFTKGPSPRNRAGQATGEDRVASSEAKGLCIAPLTKAASLTASTAGALRPRMTSEGGLRALGTRAMRRDSRRMRIGSRPGPGSVASSASSASNASEANWRLLPSSSSTMDFGSLGVFNSRSSGLVSRVWQSQSDSSLILGGGGSLTSATAPPSVPEGDEKRSLALREVETDRRILHLEAALVRSEMDLCRAKAEISTAKKEIEELKRKEGIEGADQTPSDPSALYHALEGSVVLLKIASEKMLHLERCINTHRAIMPDLLFKELQRCVTQDLASLERL